MFALTMLTAILVVLSACVVGTVLGLRSAEKSARKFRR
jgi:ABC-type dipeptide/oligopeptide/nickel transport system permease subunit